MNIFCVLTLSFRAVIRKYRVASVPNLIVKSNEEYSLSHTYCFGVSNKRGCEKEVSSSDYYWPGKLYYMTWDHQRQKHQGCETLQVQEILKKLREFQVLKSDFYFIVWLHTMTAAFPPAPWSDVWGQHKHKEGNIIFVAIWGSCCWLVLQHRLPVCGYKSLVIWERSTWSWMALRANWLLFFQ